MITKLFLIALIAYISFSAANPNEAWRKYKIDGFAGTQLQIESEALRTDNTGNAAFEDKYKLVMYLLEGGGTEHDKEFMRMEFDYYQLNNNTKTEIKFKIYLLRIVEYPRGNNTDQVYNHQNISSYSTNFPGVTWNTAAWTQVVAPHPNETRFEAKTADGVFRIYGRFSTAADYEYGNNLVKLNFEINGYPYQQMETNLAVIMRVESEYEVEGQNITPPNGEEAEGIFLGDEAAGALGTFQWATTVQDAAMVSYPVETEITHLEDPTFTEKKYHVVASFLAPQGSLVWDPSVGIEYTETQSESPGVPYTILAIGIGIAAVVVVAILVVIIAFLVVKNKKAAERREYTEIP